MMVEFTEENMKIELEKKLEEEVDSIRENTDWSVDYFEVETDGGEYIVLEDDDDATKLAEERVLQDLENEPELFNKEWREGFVNTRISPEDAGKTINELMAEDAVSEDGFSHFLAPYDGDYVETESGFIIMRVN